MRVLHFGACEGTGKGEFFVDLAIEMAQVADVHLVVPASAKYLRRLVHSNVVVHTYTGKNTRWNPYVLAQIANICRNVRPNIVHTHFAKATEMFVVINKWLKLPFVATKHNPRTGRIYNKISNVIAVSKQVAESIRGTKAKVIYNGIREVEVKRTPLPQDVFRVVSVGRLDPIKGFDRLIKAMREPPDNVYLDIYGTGPQYDELDRLIKKYGLGKRVKLRGFVDNIPERLANAHMAVVSSLKEGGPVAAIEALFYSPLLISTSVGIVPEFLPSKFICDHEKMGEKIQWGMRNFTRLTAEFDNVRRQWKPRLTLETVVREHLDYYGTVLQTGS